MVSVPLREWSGINLNDTVFNESVGSDKFVIRRIVDNVQNSGFARNSFGGPVEVSLFESKGSELEVSSSDSNSSDPSGIRDEFSVGDGSSLFEGTFFLVDWHSSTGESSLVS